MSNITKNETQSGITTNNSRGVNILKNENLNLGLVLFLFFIVQTIITIFICFYSLYQLKLLKNDIEQYKIQVTETFDQQKLFIQKEWSRLDNKLVYLENNNANYN